MPARRRKPVDTTRLGDQAEASFLHRAITHRLAVSKPWSSTERYGFIVDGGGRRWRIQVKSCRTQKHELYGYGFRAHSGGRGPRLPYTADQIDILAAYVVPEDRWYIIPLEDLNGVLTFVIHTRPVSSRRKKGGPLRTRELGAYYEAWRILTGKDASAKFVQGEPSCSPHGRGRPCLHQTREQRGSPYTG